MTQSLLDKPFRGPFLGLDTTREPRELDQRYAVDARNVILSNGRIQPRPPLGVFSEFFNHGAVLSMYHWREPVTLTDMVFVKTDAPVNATGVQAPNGGELWVVADGEQRSLVGGLSRHPATFVPIHGQVYICDGGPRVLKTDGFTFGYVGLVRPSDGDRIKQRGGVPVPKTPFYWQWGTLPAQLSPRIGSNTLGLGTYRWVVTFFDRETGIESNARSTTTLDIDASKADRFQFWVRWLENRLPPAPPNQYSHVRLYRKRVDLSETGFQLVDERPAFGNTATDSFLPTLTAPVVIDPGGEIGVSSPTAGPFAPSKNGVPGNATMMAYYKDRMFYNDITAPNLIRYSAFGKPDHVDPDDWQPLLGDEAPGITGMAELSGQLVISKPRSIWILSGTIRTSTNETIATGARPPNSGHTLYRTESPIGSANRNGPNGLIVAGHPPLLYFAAESGFYAFDGVDARMVSERIKPTWTEWARRDSRHTEPSAGDDELYQQVTYAIDPFDEIIYLAQTLQSRGSVPAALCYHYGAGGAWTYLTLSIAEAAGEARATCVATALGRGGSDTSELPQITGVTSDGDPPWRKRSSLLVGTSTGLMMASKSDGFQGNPTMRYETGDLVLAEGRLTHLYTMTYLHTSFAQGGREGFRLGFSLEGGPDEMTFAPMADAVYTRLPVRATVDRIRLVIESDELTFWNQKAGIVGWAFDPEVAGRGT